MSYDQTAADALREIATRDARIAELESVLRDLTALVRGECPQLLDEDRGGDAGLALRIEDVAGE